MGAVADRRVYQANDFDGCSGQLLFDRFDPFRFYANPPETIVFGFLAGFFNVSFLRAVFDIRMV
jgi:hypothetical protein